MAKTDDISTSRRARSRWAVFRLVLITAAMAACAEGTVAYADTQRWVPERIKVANGAVIMAGPAGYCIDTSASRDGKQGAFVLFGSCASLSDSPKGKRPQIPAILMATVASRDSNSTPFRATFRAMANFLSSPAGRAALSRNGRAESVKIMQIIAAGDVLYIHASDKAPAKGQNVEAEYWRALISVKDKLITLTVLGLKDHPLASEVKHDLLREFAAKIAKVNHS